LAFIPPLPQNLKKIRTPILVICGNKDLDNGNPKELQLYLPNSQLIIVHGDHNNTYTQDNFANAVMRFISSEEKLN